jgi:hypothetical protein
MHWPRAAYVCGGITVPETSTQFATRPFEVFHDALVFLGAGANKPITQR